VTAAPIGSVLAVVLAGGTSRRFGGGDKTAAALGGTTVTGALLASLAALPDELPDGLTVVVVGPEAGGGPAAALAAGLAGAERADVVLALAGDLPFAAPAAPRLLAALAAPEVDAALGVDPGGRRQYLLAAYRAAPLRRALEGVGVGGGEAGTGNAGTSMRSVVAGLRVAEVPVTAREALDVDTTADLERARALWSSP
jgi:molybdopterin-guanine dinucleotide biosynthesis protein A